MTKNKIHHSFSILLYLIPLSIIAGCASQKNAQSGKTAQPANWKNLYSFHAGDSTWVVKPVPATGNQFSGIIFRPEEVRKLRKVKIYAEPLSAVTIKDGKISVPMENIVKVENFKIGAGTVLLIAGIVILLFLVPTYL